MSGVYIKGIEMPKEGSWKEIRIYPDGFCVIPNWQGDCTFIKGAKAIPVPDHERLGTWIPAPEVGDCCYFCSECNFMRDAYILDTKNFCPYCGARMVSDDV